MRGAKFSVRLHQSGYGYESLREIWTVADRLGYYSATLYDLINAPALECWTTLAALAVETQRIRLTPLVLANTYRHPALLAKMAATLDVISQGRLELGLGAGGGRDDHRASGLAFPATPARVEMLEEAARLMVRLWTEAEVDFTGRHYTLRGAVCDPKPRQEGGPPLLIGGHGERYLLRAVARCADLCNMGFELSVAEHGDRLRVLADHCRAVGRDPADIEVTHNTRVLVGATAQDFADRVARHAERAGRDRAEYRSSLGRAIAGTPEECAQQLQQYLDSGIAYFFLLFPEPAEPEDIELFAREVMPRFVSSGPTR